MRKVILLAIAITTICSGCSSYYNFKFDSDPEAAKVYCGGNYFGTTPFFMHAEKDVIDKNRNGEYIDTGTPCDVVWPSGAQAKTPRYVRAGRSDTVVIHVARPRDYPNLKLDYLVAKQNEQINIQKQQLEQLNLTSRVYFLSTNFNSYPARFKE